VQRACELLLKKSLKSIVIASMVFQLTPKVFAVDAESSAVESSGEADLQGLWREYKYDSRGKRNPFVPVSTRKPAAVEKQNAPLLPLQHFDLAELHLVGIIWDVRKPKAMLRDPVGKTHIVGPNTKVGLRNGYIAVIREGEIVVVETVEQEGHMMSTAQVVKVAK
jgi:Tfp pilus assembly protein PilP